VKLPVHDVVTGHPVAIIDPVPSTISVNTAQRSE
jgi:hypothetical protein